METFIDILALITALFTVLLIVRYNGLRSDLERERKVRVNQDNLTEQRMDAQREALSKVRTRINAVETFADKSFAVFEALENYIKEQEDIVKKLQEDAAKDRLEVMNAKSLSRLADVANGKSLAMVFAQLGYKVVEYSPSGMPYTVEKIKQPKSSK